jgi:small subunit ribosomal protein S10
MTNTEKKVNPIESNDGSQPASTSDGIKKPKAVKVKAPKVKKVSPKKEKPAPSARSGRAEDAEGKVILRIRVRAYESKILDSSVKQIMDTAIRYDAVIVGPVPLPTEIKKYTVNRSPFIYKNTREQFEIRVHKRLIDIVNPNPKTVEALTNLSLPSGVDIDVKML